MELHDIIVPLQSSTNDLFGEDTYREGLNKLFHREIETTLFYLYLFVHYLVLSDV